MPHGPGNGQRVRIALAVVTLALLQAAISFRQCADLEYPGNYDTAYYFTVARNFATGRGLTESVLWHYLGPLRPIERPAGDCWMVGWPLVLGTLMIGFGHSGPDALRICAGLSVLLPLLAFRLSWRLRPEVGTSLLAGLLVCGQTRLYQSNVTPDVTLCYQLLTLFAIGTGLYALRHDVSSLRLVWAGVALSLPMWVRGEGFVALLAVTLALLIWGGGGQRRRLGRAGWVILGAVCGVAPLFVYHLAAFGRLSPEPRSLTFWLREMDELYRMDSDPSFRGWLSQGVQRIGYERLRCLRALTYNILIQIAWPLLLSAAAGILSGIARGRPEVFCLTLFLLLSAAVPTALVPFFTNPDRLVMHALPVLCALSAFAVGDFLEHLRGKPLGARMAGLAATAIWIAGWILVRAPLNSQGHFEHGWKAQFRPVPAHLVAAARRLGLTPADAILTQDPWQVAAVLDVHTVMIPYDGPGAMKRVVKLYHPRFVLLPDENSKEANPKLVGYFKDYREILDSLGFRQVLQVGSYRWYEQFPPRATTPVWGG